jgi:hypothetical protein
MADWLWAVDDADGWMDGWKEEQRGLASLVLAGM